MLIPCFYRCFRLKHPTLILLHDSAGTMINMVFPKSIQALSLDTGDEIGVTLFRQPPLPPPHIH